MAVNDSVEGTDFSDIHWEGGECRCLAHIETPTFKNLNLDLDCILGNNVNNTLQMGNRGMKKLKREVHRNFMVWFFRKYNNLYFKAHQKIAEPFRLGDPLAHPLVSASSNLGVGSSYSRQALSTLVEQMSLGRLIQCLTTLLAMSLCLVPTEVYFAATCDGFLSVLCLLCVFYLGVKNALRFPSATTNLFFPIYTDQVPSCSSHPLHAWVLWQS